MNNKVFRIQMINRGKKCLKNGAITLYHISYIIYQISYGSTKVVGIDCKCSMQVTAVTTFSYWTLRK